MNEDWTDDRLDDVIDATARRMTDGAPRPGLARRVGERLQSQRPWFAPAWRLASAMLAFALLLVAIWGLWPGAPGAPQRQARVPTNAPVSRPASPPIPTIIAQNPTLPPRVAANRAPRRPTMIIELRSDDIPALDAPAALSVDAPPVAQLRVAPLEVPELSVPPLEAERDGKPQ